MDTSLLSGTRSVRALSTPLVVVSLFVGRVWADEQLPSMSHREISSSSSQPSVLERGIQFSWDRFSRGKAFSKWELPPAPRVSRSHRPLRRITLVGGDRFVAECLEWAQDSATFRLQGGRTIRVPLVALAAWANPPTEMDLLQESFEDGAAKVAGQWDSLQDAMFDETQAVDGRHSLRFDSSSTASRCTFAPQAAARIEFSFRVQTDFSSAKVGEWQLEWNDSEVRQPPIIVSIGSDQRIDVTNLPQGADTSLQPLTLTDGWHSFIAVVTPERTRLIVDNAILASFPTPRASIHAIQFRSVKPPSKNVLWIDAFQVRRLAAAERRDRLRDESFDSDLVRLVTGDDLFGRLMEVTPQEVVFEAFEQRQLRTWPEVAGLIWRRPSIPVQQREHVVTGIVSSIELQPFVDRPDCEPERWTATIVRIDADRLVARHPLVGELVLRWSEIRRVDPLFFGATVLLDARRFHLGNSIRSDFHRHLPDGTELRGDFRLPSVPAGQPTLSLDVAEIEAAGPDAPPASPFLTELRAGELLTEVFVNDQRIGNLNSLLRFKSHIATPDRLRLAIPRGVLKEGTNSFRVTQKPLKPAGHEFDDGEVGNLRLEFEKTE